MVKKTYFIFTLIPLLLTAIGLWLTGQAVAPRTATLEDVRAEAQKSGYRIISTEELAARFEKNPAGMLLVDTRQEWEFRTGHIKGAINFPMEPTGWARWSKAGALETFLGPDIDRFIVFY